MVHGVDSNAVRMGIIGVGMGAGLGVALARCSQSLKTPIVVKPDSE